MTNKTYISLGTYKDGFNEGVRQTKAECKEKFKEWINGLEQVHYCPKCKSFYCYSEEHKKIIYVNYEELQKADEEEKA